MSNNDPITILLVMIVLALSVHVLIVDHRLYDLEQRMQHVEQVKP